jgi:outer membrane protein insertion porin family
MTLSARQVTSFTLFRWICYSLLGFMLIPSCTVPRKYQHYKPFVYKTNINIIGNMPGSTRRELIEKLQNQLDDSLRIQVKSYAGVRKEIIKPPVFDTINLGRSKVFMRSLLHSNGYFQPVITDTFTIDTVKKAQYRVTITFRVTPGKVTRLDSVGFALTTPELQQLALRDRERSLLKKGDPFTIQSVSSELDRLVELYRNHGYYKLSREDFYAERDTVVAALIDPTLDPFEQLALLDSLRKKRENPTINVVIKQNPVKDSTHLLKFYMGNVAVYPDIYILEDSVEAKRDSTMVRGIKFYYNSDKFKLPFIARNVSLRPGVQYTQRRYFRTINNFNQLGAWQNVDLSLQERYDSIPLLDATLKLYPEEKYSAKIDFEASRNVSDFLTTGTLFGIGLSARLLNRRTFREAIQSVTNARFGIELGKNIIQTLQTNLSHNIAIPRFVSPFRNKGDSVIAPKTIISLNAAYTDRFQFFKVRSFNASWGYEWTERNRRSEQQERTGREWRKTWQWTLLNYEYTSVVKTDSLRSLQEKIPSYRFAFNDGMIVSQIGSFTAGREYDNKFTLARAKVEESGALLGLIKSIELGSLRRFIKVDGEFKHYIHHNNKRQTWAFRAYAGYGFVYGKVDTGTVDAPAIVHENNLPFFKAFFAGGPYSMRAWPIRRLGPGSSNLYDPVDKPSIERFGNVQLEFNAEYRFNITDIRGVKINSALFVDIGNIWSKEYDPDTGLQIPEASFNFGRLYKDIAIGGGSSLRFDFDFFLIRLDWAYRLKDPLYYDVKGGWFHNFEILDGQFQLGIGYPF